MKRDALIESVVYLAMKFTKDIVINAPASKVWDLSAHKFADVGVWATAVSSSSGKEGMPKVNGSPVGGRVCKTSFGDAHEDFTMYNEEKMTYSFSGSFKSKMFNDITSTIRVEAIDENTTKVYTTPEIKLTLLGKIMSPMIKMTFGKAIDEVLDDMKYYIENGKPSPRKEASMK